MALGATIYTFEIHLADADRHVYETLNLKLARHPSESAEYLCTRLLAYCLEYAPGIAFSRGGLSDTDLPAVSVHDLTGTLLSWIEVGAPDASRLHRATKAASRVAVYLHRDPGPVLERWSRERIHRVAEIAAYALEPAFVEALAARLERRQTLDLSVADAHLYLSAGEDTLTTPLVRLDLSATR